MAKAGPRGVGRLFTECKSMFGEIETSYKKPFFK